MLTYARKMQCPCIHYEGATVAFSRNIMFVRIFRTLWHSPGDYYARHFFPNAILAQTTEDALLLHYENEPSTEVLQVCRPQRDICGGQRRLRLKKMSAI